MAEQQPTIGKLTGGPLDGQLLPLDGSADDELVLPYADSQVIYRRTGAVQNTGASDGAATATYRFVRTTDDITPDDQID